MWAVAGLAARVAGALVFAAPRAETADEQAERERRIANERLMLTVEFFNRMSVGLVLAGIGTPFTVFLDQTPGAEPTPPYEGAPLPFDPLVIVLSVSLIVAGLCLYYLARRNLGKLQ